MSCVIFAHVATVVLSRPPPDDYLALNGDECGDSEPAAIAIRNNCRGDAETLQMGYTRNGHGNQECWSQGNHWGNLVGMFVLVQ